jgi:peptidoglycan/LPS O-acetylase OafA/YrhL
LARIFPVYLLLLTAKYASAGFPPVKETFLNYTLLKGYSDVYNLTGIPQSWSLTVEITFYFFAPLFYIIGQRNKWLPVLYGMIGFLLVTTFGLWANRVGINRDSWSYNYLFVLNATFFGRFLEFYMGTLLAFVIRTPGVAHPYNVRYTLTGFLGILFSMFLVNCCASNGFSPGTNDLDGVLIRNLLLPVFTALFIYGLIKETTRIQRILSSGVFVLLGNASYIFYLIHINFGYYTLAKIKEFQDYNFTFLWLVSIIAYILVERPLYALAKKIIKGAPPAPAPVIVC